MDYAEPIAGLLRAIGADVGDVVELTAEGRTVSGRIMPHHDFSDAGILTLKLGTGYNVGLRVGAEDRLRLIERGEVVTRRAAPPSIRTDLPVVSFLGTGGTIASYVDYRTGAVHPALSAEDLVASIPELRERCVPRARRLFSIFSEDMTPDHWLRIATAVGEEFRAGATGVVIPHGTDTMAITAAALSFLLPKLPGPVILVGAQRSSDRPSSDAILNLLGAVEAVGERFGEVVIAMHESPSEHSLLLHRGTRVRKMHSSRRDAFRTMNGGPLARIQDGKVVYLSTPRPAADEVEVRAVLDPAVTLIWYHPSMRPAILARTLEEHRGVVIAGTGLGHIGGICLPPIREAIAKGTTVVMTTQCLEGTVDLEVYATGRDLLRAGVISGGDMIPETALVKLMWVLGQTKDLAEVKRLMQTDLVGELNPRRPLQTHTVATGSTHRPEAK